MFVADDEIKSASEPWETPVICQVAVAVPVGRVPTLKVGVVTEKWPFCELSVRETLDNWLFKAALLMFDTATVTVWVWPTCRVAGILFWLCPQVCLTVGYTLNRGMCCIGLWKLKTQAQQAKQQQLPT